MHLRSTDLSPLHNLRYDVPAGLVVFLVALPLCLGVALASGAPLVSGLVAGIVGGIVIPLISRAPLSVSGPAAGLTAIVAVGIERAGSLEAFCAATVIGGLVQIALGFARAGAFVSFVPSSVVRGMLSAIGVLLILKQLPHAIGYDTEAFDSDSFAVRGGGNTFSMLVTAVEQTRWGASVISAVSCLVLLAFDRIPALKRLSFLPGALVVVLLGTVMNELFLRFAPSLGLGAAHRVALPPSSGPFGVFEHIQFVDVGSFANSRIWVIGLTIAVVASLESLLSLEAIDRLDPFRRRSDPNRELIAQGTANSISGLIGGLPVTSVIVRSSANVNAGGRTRAATFVHGVLLLAAVMFAATALNRIPLSALAAILVVTGAKLASPSVFGAMRRMGTRHFVPFIVTIVAIVLSDLLRGIVIGLVVGIAFTIRESMKGAFEVTEDEPGVTRITFQKDLHFFHKPLLLEALESIPEQTLVIVDKGVADYVDVDVVEAVCAYRSIAGSRGVELHLEGIVPVGPVDFH